MIAAIDIGSNAVRLNIGNVIIRKGKPYVQKILLIRSPVRLGDDVFRDKQIGARKLEDLTKTLDAFGKLMEVYQVERYRVVATSAMRDAENSAEVIRQIRNATGFEIDPISGEEEASILFNIFRFAGDVNDTKLIADLGGGSTEIIIIKPNGEHKAKSFKVGAVRLLNGEVKEDEFDDLLRYVAKHCFEKRVHAIGSGGNISTLQSHFGDPLNKFMTIEQLQMAYDLLSPISADERISRYLLRPDRADVIVPAAEVFLRILQAAHCTRINVPQIGLSDGVILQLYQQYERNSLPNEESMI